MKRIVQFVTAVAAAAAIGASAHAATYDLNLSGSIANFQTYTFSGGGVLYNEHYLPLTGLDSSNAINVVQGDTINATVTFDQPLLMPASAMRTDVLLFLTGSAFPSQNTGVSGTFTLYDGASVVGGFGYYSTTSNQLSNYAALFPPYNGAYTITSFTDDFTVASLPTPATLDGAAFDYTLVSSIPEPGAWMMLILGLGLIGFATRRRREGLVLAA